MYQKPTPKQDKDGGIFPAAEVARVVLTSSKQRGRRFSAPAACSVPSIARPKNAGNPRFEYLLFLVYSILILK